MITDILEGLLSLIYPPNCIICKSYLSADSLNKFVCPFCQLKIEKNVPPFCPKCSRSLGARPVSSLCSSCKKNKTHFDFAWCACIYNDFLKQLVHAFKYQQKTYLKEYLSELMFAFLDLYNLDIYQFDYLVPIPLSSTKLRERGYNQSNLLAKILSSKYNIPLSANNLIRRRDTRSQVLLSKKERWTNMTGAFRIKNLKQIKNKNILIIDDLLTTGATSSAAAKALKEANANTVGVFTLAIAL